jgi:hypothetical protein
MLQLFSTKIFQDEHNVYTQNSTASYASQIDNILSVRLGIILLGDILSNKSTTMRMFEENYKDYRI